MKIQERRAYFGFGVRDRAEAHRWLEEQGQRDWVLTRIRTGFFPTACFAPLEGPPPRYCVDVAHWSLRDPERQRDYDRLAADAGWSLTAQISGMKIYRAQPDRDPVPLQTDPALERERYRREALLPGILTGILFPFLLLLLIWAAGGRRLCFYRLFLQSNGGLLCLAALPLLVLGMLLALRASHRDRRYRRLPLHLANAFCALVLPLCLLLSLPLHLQIAGPLEDLPSWPYLAAEDLGRSGSAPYGMVLGDSLLLKGVYVRTPLEGERSLQQTHWHCKTGWAAALGARGLRGDGLSAEGDAAVQPYRPIDLDLEEAYIADSGGYRGLILRQGSVVVLLKGPVGALSDAALPHLLECLDLKGGL